VAGVLLFGIGVWKGNTAAVVVSIILFIAAPFVFGLRAKM